MKLVFNPSRGSKGFAKAPALLLCLALWPGLLVAQQHRENIIRGKIVGPDGRGVEVLVNLQTEGGYVVSTVRSNGEGHFDFRDVHYGSYTVVVDDPSYRRAEAHAQIMDLVPVAEVYITLQPRGPSVKNTPDFDSGSSTVSVKELKTKFPKKAVKEYEKGNENLQRGDAKDAVPHYEKALQIAPNMYPVLNNLGDAYLQTHRMDLAEATFEKALAADPGAAQPLVNLGHVYYETRKYDLAEKFLLRSLERDPQSSLALFFLGLTYAHTGKREAAIENLQKSLIGGNPRVAQAHLILAQLFMNSREYSKARQHLEAYLKLRPQDPQADHIRAVLKKLKTESNP